MIDKKQNISHSLLSLFSTLLLLFISAQVTSAQTDVKPLLTLLSQRLDAKDGLRITYQYSLGDLKSEGTYYAKGQQFYLEDNMLRSWYDGANLWLFLPTSNEVNLTMPSPQELGQINPLLSLKELNTNLFEITMTTQGKSGMTLRAIPRATSGASATGIEWLTLLIHPDGTPIRLEVKEQGIKERVVLKVKNLRKGLTKEMIQKDFFSHTPNKTKGAEVIDLR